MFKKIKKAFKGAGVQAVSLSLTSDSFMYALIGILVILGPLFFVPIAGLSVPISKGFFVTLIGILGLLVYGVSTLRTGTVTMPRQRVFLALAALSLLGLLGSALSGAFGSSFIGYGFETTTWLFVTVFGLLAFFAYRTLRSYGRIGTLYGGMLLAFVVLFLVQAAHYVLDSGIFTLGVLGSSTSTLVGSWGDLAVFAGFVVLLSMVTLELAGLRRPAKIILSAIAFLAVVMLAFMNIRIVWVVVGLVSLLFTLYIFSFAYWNPGSRTYDRESRVPWFALSLFVVSIACMLFGGALSALASRHQDISYGNIRPSVTATFRVFEKSFLHNFATGYGPNSFAPAWSLVKPPALSGTTAGSADFTVGTSLVSTHLATEGVLGIVAWIAFFVLLVIAMVRRLAHGFERSLDRYVALSLMVLVTYLGTMAWVYVPGSYLLALFAVLVGALLGTDPGSGRAVAADASRRPVPARSADVSISFIDDPRASFFGILAVTVLILGTLFAGYVEARKLVSFCHYTRGMALLNAGSYQKANLEISAAAALAGHDLYHRQLAQFALSDASRVVSGATVSNKDSLSKQAQQIIGSALGHAQAAVALNGASYRNWVLLGDVYRFMVTLGIDGVSGKALSAYQEALRRNPNDSTMQLLFARLDLAGGDTDGAMAKIAGSINAYPTRDAYLLRAQVEISQQKGDAAIVSMRAAIALDPYDADLAYQYGLLLFSQKEYRDAVTAFQRTIFLNRNFGPAYVYLGVSYERSGDTASANKVYDYLRKQTSDADAAIDKIRNGDVQTPSPAADAGAPAATRPSVSPKTAPAASAAPKKPVAPAPKKQ